MTKLSNLPKLSASGSDTKLVSPNSGGGYVTASDIMSGVTIHRLSNSTILSDLIRIWGTGNWWRITNGEQIATNLGIYAAIKFDIPCDGKKKYVCFGIDAQGRGIYTCG